MSVPNALCQVDTKPLVIDLYCGLGGWTSGLIDAGYRVVGFDIQQHVYGDQSYPGQLVLQDAITIHGSQFKDAALIVASPPCQNYSYLAMPWSRSKPVECEACDGKGSWIGIPCLTCNQTGMIEHSLAAKALRKKWETEGPDNRLFDACFRIQREAIAATRRVCQSCAAHVMRGLERYPDSDDWKCGNCDGSGWTQARYIPLIVENVRGAVPWVGPAKAKFGSFYLWGDVAQIGDRVYAGSDLAGMRFGGGVAPEPNEQKREGRNFHTYALTGGAVSSPSYHGGDHETRGVGMGQKRNPDGTAHPQGSWFRIADSSQGDRGAKVPGFRFDGSGRSFQTAPVEAMDGNRRNDSGHDPARSPDSFLIEGGDGEGMPELAAVLSGVGAASRKSRSGGGWFGDSSTTREADPRDVRKQADGSWATPDGTKIGGDWFSDPNSTCRKHGSRSNARKQASAMIAKIPLALSSYIAQVHRTEALAQRMTA